MIDASKHMFSSLKTQVSRMLVFSTRHEFFRHVDLHGLAKAEVCAKKKHIFSNTTQIHRTSVSFFVLGRHLRASHPSFLAPADQQTLLESTWRDFRFELHGIGTLNLSTPNDHAEACTRLSLCYCEVLRSTVHGWVMDKQSEKFAQQKCMETILLLPILR